MDLRSSASIENARESLVSPAVQALIDAEHALHAAQLAGDVEALHRLLHPEVRFIAPDGAVLDKEGDLEAHRSGALRLSRLGEVSLEVQIEESTGLTRTVVELEGIAGGEPFAGRMIYSRTWIPFAGRWVVLAAHASELTPR
ncbi:nuclear transport factor 2 family protein [Agreia sp. COWG]|uniref:nuclear transport factor 2 family protein n=1 Tax=Agreia sp. COWG TaxID=2773266 RepID=UPI00192893E9|nr:nuclear transport factor 2 family protein [Agreia sp. COWG]